MGFDVKSASLKSSPNGFSVKDAYQRRIKEDAEYDIANRKVKTIDTPSKSIYASMSYSDLQKELKNKLGSVEKWD